MLIWSDKMRQLWNVHAWQLSYDHEKSNRAENVYFGFPFLVIRNDVLRQGLADFHTTYKHPLYGQLTPDEQATLYFAINFPAHFFVSYAAFAEFKAQLDSLFESSSPPRFIDIGCGPATSALAMLDLRRGQRFNYIGIDSSAAMRQKAKELLLGAKDRGIAHEKMSFALLDGWNEFPLDRLSPDIDIILNMSYFCASHSLNNASIQSLAQFIEKLKLSDCVRRLFFIYTNSTRPIANVHYQELLNSLGINSAVKNRTIHYRTKRLADNDKSTAFRFEAIFLKGG